MYVDGFYWFSRNLRTTCQGITTQGDVLGIPGGGHGREEEHINTKYHQPSLHKNFGASKHENTSTKMFMDLNQFWFIMTAIEYLRCWQQLERFNVSQLFIYFLAKTTNQSQAYLLYQSFYHTNITYPSEIEKSQIPNMIAKKLIIVLVHLYPIRNVLAKINRCQHFWFGKWISQTKLKR